MNALVGIRANTLGTLSPTPATRNQTLKMLDENIRNIEPQSLLKSQSVTKAEEPVVPTATSADSSEMDRHAFLRLLVEQLRNQDPMSPVDSPEMIAQLAQFSSLEQMENLNENFQQFSGNMDQLNFISASGLIGKHIIGVDLDGFPVSGVVEQIQLDGSIVHLNVDGHIVSMAGVLGVQEPQEEPAA
jgi:flagellar basal-body rod modification protein FlgD